MPDLLDFMEGEARFDGQTYEPAKDKIRLTKQALRVFDVMKDGQWRTLREIEDATGDPQASISARLRDFRKERFGGHTVERHRDMSFHHGIFKYRLVVEKSVEIL